MLLLGSSKYYTALFLFHRVLYLPQYLPGLRDDCSKRSTASRISSGESVRRRIVSHLSRTIGDTRPDTAAEEI